MTVNLMTRVRRAAVALAIATPALVSGATPAGAVATASMVDNGNGSITITYAGTVALGDNVVVAFRDPSATCSAYSVVPYLYLMDANGEIGATMPGSPAVVTAGTVAQSSVSQGPEPIVDGSYRVCVILTDPTNPQGDSLAGDLVVTIGNLQAPAPNPPPVTPAYTG